MIINSKNERQRKILTNKCFYQTTAQIVCDFAKKGYLNPTDEAAKAISAYHDLVQKKVKNNFSKDYNEAFSKIDASIKDMAHKVFYIYDSKSFDIAYQAFRDFDHIQAILAWKRLKKS